MSTNNSLENILYEGDDEMGIFNIFGSKDKGIARAGEHLEDPERREALKTIGKIATVAVGATIFPEEVEARDYTRFYSNSRNQEIITKQFPPGIQLCLSDLINKENNYKDAYHIFQAYAWGVIQLQKGERDISFYNGIVKQLSFCKDSTVYSQPAWWYIVNVLPESMKRNHLNINDKKKKLFEKNKPLSSFEAGISYYFSSWNIYWAGEKKMWKDKKKVEIYFLKSIFKSSNIYYSKDEYIKLNNKLKQSGLNEDYFDLNNLNVNVEKYVNLDLQRKQIVMEQIRDNLFVADYNKQLVASWSGFFLVDHLEALKKDENNMIYSVVEMSLRKKYPKLKIRGPPHFHLTN